MKGFLFLIVFCFSTLGFSQEYNVAKPKRTFASGFFINDISSPSGIIYTSFWHNAFREDLLQRFYADSFLVEQPGFNPNYLRTDVEVDLVKSDSKNNYIRATITVYLAKEGLLVFMKRMSTKVRGIPRNLTDARFIYGLMRPDIYPIMDSIVSDINTSQEVNYSLTWRTLVSSVGGDSLRLEVGYADYLKVGDRLAVYDSETSKLKALVQLETVESRRSKAKIVEQSNTINVFDVVKIAFEEEK